VTSMYRMFSEAPAFDQDITGWTTPALSVGRCRLNPG